MEVNQFHYGPGDNVAGDKIVNIGPPDPKITITPIQTNIERDGKFFSSFMLDIESVAAIPNLYLQANAQTIESFDPSPQRIGVTMIGHSGKRDGFAFTNLQQAHGKYLLSIVTRKAGEITFIANID